MSAHDEQVELVAAAMCSADTTSWKNTSNTQTLPDVSWSDMYNATEHIPYEGISLGRDHYRAMARAAIEAMGEAEPLEDVLGNLDVGQILLSPRYGPPLTNRWNAELDIYDENTEEYVTEHGIGLTVDDAIRAAVANAKGEN